MPQPRSVRGELLAHDHERGDRGRHDERAHHELADHELERRLRERGRERAEAHARDRDQEDPAPPDPIRERQQQERGQRAEPRRRGELALLRLVEPERRCDLRQRVAEHAEVVVLEEHRERDEAEHAQVRGLHAVGHAAQERRDPPGIPPREVIPTAGVVHLHRVADARSRPKV